MNPQEENRLTPEADAEALRAIEALESEESGSIEQLVPEPLVIVTPNPLPRHTESAQPIQPVQPIQPTTNFSLSEPKKHSKFVPVFLIILVIASAIIAGYFIWLEINN